MHELLLCLSVLLMLAAFHPWEQSRRLHRFPHFVPKVGSKSFAFALLVRRLLASLLAANKPSGSILDSFGRQKVLKRLTTRLNCTEFAFGPFFGDSFRRLLLNRVPIFPIFIQPSPHAKAKRYGLSCLTQIQQSCKPRTAKNYGYTTPAIALGGAS